MQAFGAREQVLQQLRQPPLAAAKRSRAAGGRHERTWQDAAIDPGAPRCDRRDRLFLVGGVGVIGATTDLAGAVIAAGTLVVESNVKKVQHPTGGIVGDLLVHDGSRVEAGELLVRLDETTAQANLAMVDKSLAELFARRARLEAERDGIDTVEFPDELLQAARQAEIARVVAGERKLFQLRREAQEGQKAQLRERIIQLNEEVRGYTDQAGAKTKEIEFIQKELEGVRELWQKNLVPITRVTALERDGARLEGERGQLIATVAQGKGKVSETELQIIQLDQNLRSDVAKELADIRAKIAELVERKVTAMDQLQRIEIRAPQAGVVQQLAVHAKGAERAKTGGGSGLTARCDVPRFAGAAKTDFEETMSGMPRPDCHTTIVSDDACITPYVDHTTLARVGHTVCCMWQGCMRDACAPLQARKFKSGKVPKQK